ncbi:amino acid adenylation domain-containing protein [Pendulispora rubella]|uniref:Amino acid adenylation domain-containing protein n=1 Tax=Pendulispora rubella TaxID=2741070 RepID=A0ABZ2LD00_9BACT
MTSAVDTRPNQDPKSVLSRALREIREYRSRVAVLEAAQNEPIAIVGMACRLPGGISDPDGLWQLLVAGGDAIGHAPDDRWGEAEFQGSCTRSGGFVRDLDAFDAQFFGISPREAVSLDPQQRLFLEMSWEALENAGQSPDELAETATGVFVGITNYDYCQVMMQKTEPSELDAYCLTSNASTFAAGRLSYWLNLRGPSLSVDTACSSSLVAVHLACQSLRSGECATAIAGGVNALLAPEWFVVLSRARMLAPDGRCKTFSRDADGYARAEGGAVVVLKRLSDATAHRDHIYGVIRGSAMNQDGQSGGITVPNPAAQQAVIREALRRARVSPSAIGYVEAHGTGTPLGDPIELRALSAVLSEGRSRDRWVNVGAIKANVGHLEPAAGVTGLLKVALTLEHGAIPPQIHLGELNPNIDVDELGVRIPKEIVPWPRGTEARIAGLSSFGASGTNVHMVVEEGPRSWTRPSASIERSLHVLTVSAKSEASLIEAVADLREYLARHPHVPLANIAFTRNTGRAHFAHRFAVVASDHASAIAELDGFAQSGHCTRAPSRARPRVAFLFTGQGAQYAGMARGLYAAHPTFRSIIDECDAFLVPHMDRRLKDVLFGESDAWIDLTRYTQPALFAVEYALAKLWMSWGVQPAALLGHSVGEYVAACIAGIFSLEDALKLIAARAAMMQRVTLRGAMASVAAPREKVEAALRPHAREVSLAAINGAESTVISGDEARVEALMAQFGGEGIKCKRLTVSHAFHSPHMDAVVDPLAVVAAEIEFERPEIPVISNLTGQPLSAMLPMDGQYFADHARQPVDFLAGLQHLHAQGVDAFVEMGPAPVLLAMAKSSAPSEGAQFLPSLRKGRSDWQTLLPSLAALYQAGADIDWDGFDRDYERERVALPTYPFQRKRFWFSTNAVSAPSAPALGRGRARQTPSLLGEKIVSPLEGIQFQNTYSIAAHPCLGDCVLDDLKVVNIGVYIEAARRAAGKPSVLRDLVVVSPFVLRDDEERPVHVILHPEGEGHRFEYFSQADRWTLHVQAQLEPGASPLGESLPIDELQVRLREEIDAATFYYLMAQRRLHLGPSARWIEHAWRIDGEALARMRAPRVGEAEPYLLHPGLIDAALQLLFACFGKEQSRDATYMLVSIDRASFAAYPGGETLCHAKLREVKGDGRSLVADVALADARGNVFARLEGAHLRLASRNAVAEGIRVAAAHAHPHPSPPPGGEGAGTARDITQRVAAILRMDVADIDPKVPLHTLGFDSLMTVELANVTKRDFGITLPLTLVADGASLETVIALLTAPSPSEVRGLPRPTFNAAGGPGRGSHDVLTHDAPSRHAPFNLTDLQQAYLLGRSGLFELGDTSTYFFLEVDITDLDLPRFESSFRAVIRRHDMLRAVVSPDGEQRVLPEVPDYVIDTLDLRGREPADVEAALLAIRAQMSEQVLPTDRFPLFDVRATLLDNGVTRIHLGFDALIVDAWSTSLLLREWATIYRGAGASLPKLEITFRDYVRGLERLEDTDSYRTARAYWMERIPTLPPPPELPLAKSPALVKKGRFVHRSTRLGAERWQRLQEHAKRFGVTTSAAICTAYAEVLAAWSKSSRFTLNVLFFNRRPLHPQVSQLVGNFSATSLLEVDSDPREGFTNRARKLQRQLWSDLEHSEMSGVRVLREFNRLHGNRARAGMPVVFASTINFRTDDEPVPLGLGQHLSAMGTSAREVGSSIRTPQVWLDHQVVQDGGELVVNWDVVEELMPEGMISAMFAAYRDLLVRLADDPQAWETARLLTPDEDLETRRKANDTAASVPDGLLHDAFGRRAAEAPARIAVATATRTLSYGEVDRLSNRLAHWLRRNGARPNQLVAVRMEKGWEQVVAVLAVLKSGAAYVPIDARLPEDRVRTLLVDAQVSLVLTQSWLEPVPVDGIATRCVDPELQAATTHDDTRPPAPIQRPSDLAYVIYTSGSTGIPKGVMIEHRAALNTIVDLNERFHVTASDRVLSLSALNFDLSVYDIFGLLAVGGTIVLPDPRELREPAHWASLVVQHGVTIWNTVPALMEMLVGYGSPRKEPLPLRTIMMSGDWIPVTLPDRIREWLPEADVYSLGGATEAAIWSIYYPITETKLGWASVPYGKPLRNQRMYVFNDAMQPCPTWVPGQLYIGGEGIARGYWRDEVKTRRSFLRHPVSGERLYRTGDLGRYWPDGNIEFLGREDGQVKIQGYRIELGEIEAALAQHPAVRAVAATAVGEARANNKRLVGFAQLDDSSVSGEDLRAWLLGKIPEYAVPQAITVVPNLPLSANGKVDRAALVQMASHSAGDQGAPVAPRTETERALVDIWRQLLACEEIGIRQSFFDAGGSSVTAVRLMSRIHQRFDIELPLSTLFEHPTIEQLAQSIETGAHRRALVAIQPQGTGTPFFFMHPVGGNVLCYAELARALGREQPFYGLQALPDQGDTLEEMARHYIAEIRQVQPHGPYRLGGWSMGGVLAFEMAQQLRAAGEAIALLTLLDVTESPSSDAKHPPVDEGALRTWFETDLAGAAVDETPSLFSLFKRNSKALLTYPSKPYDGRILFFRGSNPGGARAEVAQAWLQITQGGRVIDLACDHYGIVRAPFIDTIATELRKEIQ